MKTTTILILCVIGIVMTISGCIENETTEPEVKYVSGIDVTTTLNDSVQTGFNFGGKTLNAFRKANSYISNSTGGFRTSGGDRYAGGTQSTEIILADGSRSTLVISTDVKNTASYKTSLNNYNRPSFSRESSSTIDAFGRYRNGSYAKPDVNKARDYKSVGSSFKSARDKAWGNVTAQPSWSSRRDKLNKAKKAYSDGRGGTTK